MDLLRMQCFPKERDYLLDVSGWNQKMGFACIAIIERPLERRRLTDQVGNMMVPDMCVTSAIDCYIADTFAEENKDTIKWLSKKEKAREPQRADDSGPHASPAQHPLTLDSVLPTIHPEDGRPAQNDEEVTYEDEQQPSESRTEENVAEDEPETVESQSEAGEELLEETGTPQAAATPLSLCTLLKIHGRLIKAMNKHRNMLCKKACGIDSLQDTLPAPFVPLYNKAEDELKEFKKKIRRQIKRLGFRVLRYLKLLDRETKLRQQIYQNLLHVTPLQVLLLGHLPRDQQMALLDVISRVRKFCVPLLVSRFHEIKRVQEIEKSGLPGHDKIQI